MKGTRTWWRSHQQEVAAGLISGLVSLVVYVWSAAPNVTLLDSGEFLVAAQHFGVPHPTGYPLWTLLSWLFQLLPLGNAAWEINVFSGICTALAVAVCAGVLTNLLRWFLEGSLRGLMIWTPPILGIAFSLMFAFSVSVWSQAVIAEVYGLHALVIGLYLAVLYGWVRNPSRDRLMLFAFFLLALAFSNHHLTLTLTPLPFLLILLLRRRALPDWIFAGVLTLLLGYLGFAILSEDPQILKTAIRLFYVVMAAGVVFVWIRKMRIRWKLVAFLPIAVGAGLLPYAYMPIASSTNPPMNWAYAREQKGFFFSVNRSQYSGSLSDQSIKVLGRLMGTKGSESTNEPFKRQGRSGKLEAAQVWVGFFWQQLSRAFTPFALIGYFASILFILRYPLPQRTWIYCLHFAFVLAAFLQPALDGALIDKAGWWLQMPFHTYTNFIFALLSGLGTGLLISFLASRRAAWFWLAPLMLVLPVLTFRNSEAESSQRNRWFGWMFGYDMLKDLPKGSVVIGGSDPGRFVPTYMILGESGQPAAHKRDPNFDRRDLYIITQNALGEEFYMKYIRDHYGPERPAPKNAFEKWLGRANAYPEKPLVLPSEEEVKAIFEKLLSPDAASGTVVEEDPTIRIFSAVLKWIWENNREEHDFFIEESFQIPWSYDYALPHGLTYKLSKTKVESLTPEIVAEDFAFWADYKKKLLSDPAYLKDFDAQRSFSKLRSTMGNIYNHRNMLPEAERVYLEALELWPANPEVLNAYSEILWNRGDFDGVRKMLEIAYDWDPNNTGLIMLYGLSEQRRESQTEIASLHATLKTNAADAEAFTKLLKLYAGWGETNKAGDLLQSNIHRFTNSPSTLKAIASYAESTQMKSEFVEAAGYLSEASPKDPISHYILARALLAAGSTNEAFTAASNSVSLGGRSIRSLLASDPAFANAIKSAPFDSLVKPTVPTP